MKGIKRKLVKGVALFVAFLVVIVVLGSLYLLFWSSISGGNHFDAKRNFCEEQGYEALLHSKYCLSDDGRLIEYDFSCANYWCTKLNATRSFVFDRESEKGE